MANVQGKMGMTKALKRADRLNHMESNRKRDKARQRAAYHSEFKRRPGKRGYPRGAPGLLGFTAPK